MVENSTRMTILLSLNIYSISIKLQKKYEEEYFYI